MSFTLYYSKNTLYSNNLLTLDCMNDLNLIFPFPIEHRKFSKGFNNFYNECLNDITDGNKHIILIRSNNNQMVNFISIKKELSHLLDFPTEDDYEKYIINNPNVYLMFIDTDSEDVNSLIIALIMGNVYNELSDRTFLITTSHDQKITEELVTDEYIKQVFFVPSFLLKFHININNHEINTHNIISNHDVNLKKKFFLCLMNNAYLSRNDFYLWYKGFTLADDCLLSYVCNGLRIPGDYDDDMQILNDIGRLYSNPKWYRDTLFSVIMESRKSYSRITNKVLKAIINEHPFYIYVSREYMKVLGECLSCDFEHEFLMKTLFEHYDEENFIVDEFINVIDEFVWNYHDTEQFYKQLYTEDAVNIRKRIKHNLLSVDFCKKKVSEYSRKVISELMEL